MMHENVPSPIAVLVVAAACWCGASPPRRPRFFAHSLSLGGTPASSTTVRSKSVPAPGFDAFARSIVGEWSVTAADDDDGHGSVWGDDGGGDGAAAAEPGHHDPPPPAAPARTPSAPWTVEEVMRRCGGAVQGVREVPPARPPSSSRGGGPTGTDAMDGPTYLNRADDGFVYMDCGSYTSGPTRVDMGGGDVEDDDGGGRAEVDMTCSFSFPSQGKRSVVSIRSPPGERTSLSCVTLSRPGPHGAVPDASEEPMDGSGAPDEHAPSSHPERATVDSSTLASIVWEDETSCRMSSPTDPWMLPRAKWEAYVCGAEGSEHPASAAVVPPEEVSEGEHEVAPLLDPSTVVWLPGADGIVSWATILEPERSTHGPLRIPNLCASQELRKFVGVATDGGFLVAQVGALCLRTGEARAFLRGYDSRRGELRGVAFQRGRAVQ